jgi:hypothetical protein
MICRPTEGWWSATALLAARERFHPRVVEIFYDALEVEHVNAGEARDHLLPSPTDGDYRRVLLRGATGAGETTLLGQLIGTDPDDERFPLRPRAAPRSRLPRSSPPKDRTRRRSPSSRWTRSASTWSTVHRARSWPRTAATGVRRFSVRCSSDPDQQFRFNHVLGDGHVSSDGLLWPAGWSPIRRGPPCVARWPAPSNAPMVWIASSARSPTARRSPWPGLRPGWSAPVSTTT